MTGLSDGYNGHWEPRQKAESDHNIEVEKPAGVWPVKQEDIPTIFSMLRDEHGIFHWTCRECGVTITTQKYIRPRHVCATRIDKA